MYSSSSNFDPFHYPTITYSLTATENPNPVQQVPSLPFIQFPSPFLDDNGDLLPSELLVQHQNQQQQVLGSNASLAAETNDQEMNRAVSKKPIRIHNKKKKISNKNDRKQQILQKRSGKNDRHSKIYTAKGPRDRRMRLSLQIARKFFDLQDMLGFDKASKTIDWLFTKSKAAIKELTAENGEILGFENQEMESSSLKIDYAEEQREEEEKAAAGTHSLPHQFDSTSIVDKILGFTGATKSSSIFNLSHQNVVGPSGADSADEFSGFPGNWEISIERIHDRYSAIPNIKLSTTGNVPVQNPNTIFMANQKSLEQKASSTFVAQEQNFDSALMATLEPQPNPSSLFMNFSNSNQQNHTEFPITTLHSHLTEPFFCNL